MAYLLPAMDGILADTISIVEVAAAGATAADAVGDVAAGMYNDLTSERTLARGQRSRWAWRTLRFVSLMKKSECVHEAEYGVAASLGFEYAARLFRSVRMLLQNQHHKAVIGVERKGKRDEEGKLEGQGMRESHDTI